VQPFQAWEHFGYCRIVKNHLVQEAEAGQQPVFLCDGMHVCPSFYAAVRLVQQEQDLDHRNPMRPSDSIAHPCSEVVVVAAVAVAELAAATG
jgi:hypothetical protein